MRTDVDPRAARAARRATSTLFTILGSLAVALSPLLWTAIASSPALAQPFQTPDDPTQHAADVRRAEANGGVSPDRLIVIYTDATGLSDPIRVNARRTVGGTLLRAEASIPRDVLRVAGGNAVSAAERVRHMAGVRDAYPDRIVSIAMTVNDPYLRKEWGLAKIQAATAWDASQGVGIKVAVLDCGIHASHPDLAGKVVLERNFTASPTSDDGCNHGTHVAGTIGAVTNNATGVAAVAPGATLLNGKVLDDSGSGMFSDLDTAIQWAADNGAKVINMSLGATIPCLTGTQLAANYAWNRGVVLVAAAGNSNASGAIAPADCNNVIGVAATDSHDAKAAFSNYGPEVEVAAPGVGIESTVNPALNAGKAYASLSGTSMASPHVAGVLALIWATGYGSGPAAVRDRLFSTADAITGTGASWTYGRINASAAVAGAPPPPPSVSPSPPAAPGLVTVVIRPAFIRLAWVASPTAGVTYTLYRGEILGGPNTPLAANMSRTRYDDRDVVSSQLYCYYVTAWNDLGESPPSPTVCDTAR
jgi:thermitase